eukprot:SAG31_NODE_1300_length_8906_cov_139.354604_2_plen_64_part_00
MLNDSAVATDQHCDGTVKQRLAMKIVRCAHCASVLPDSALVCTTRPCTAKGVLHDLVSVGDLK